MTYDCRSYCRICLQKSKFVSACSSGGKKKSSLSKESLFSTEGKGRLRAMVIEGWVAGLS